MNWPSIRDFLRIPPELTGRGVNIAIVDASFARHPDIATNASRQAYIVTTSKPDAEPELMMPAEGPWEKGLHGLWAASAAAGSGSIGNGLYTGAAPEANLYLLETGAFRTLDDIESKFVAALRWLVMNWRTYNIRGVVLTLGVTRDSTGQLPWQVDPIRVLCEQLADEGVLVVIASGNTTDITCSGPASSPSALSVGGVVVPRDAVLENAAAYHGCRGTTFEGRWIPDILAPAENVVLPMPFRSYEDYQNHATASHDQLPDGYARMEGTSYAAPIILGCAACLWQARPDWTANQVKSAITGSSTAGRWSEELNAGIIDVAAALRMTPSVERPHSPYSIWSKWKEERVGKRIEILGQKTSEDVAAVMLSFSESSLGSNVKELMRHQLHHNSDDARAAALSVLALNVENLTKDDILLSLDDRNSHVRSAGLFALSRSPHSWIEFEGAIIRLLEDPDPNVRFCALELAARMKASSFIGPIIAGLYDDAISQRVSIFGARCRALEAITGQSFAALSEWREGECWYSEKWMRSRIHIAERWVEWDER